MKESNNFKFFVDNLTLEKAGKDEQGRDIMKVGGIASTSTEDSDGEEIDEQGWDTSYFLQSGFFNYNHQAKFNPKAVIGEPTVARITKKGVYVEGFLYPDSELAKSVYDTAEMLQKSSSKRRMGFSIEGQALERDPLNPKKITKAKLTGCALTLNPKNPNTLVNILKGDYHENELEYEESTPVTKDLVQKSEDYIVYVEKDGKILQIDKELRIKITDNKSVEKSLETTSPVVVESVDQEVKDKEKRLPSLEKKLSKGGVFSEIFNYIYVDNLEKAELFYELVKAFSQKRNQMEDTSKELVNITTEDIQKSLDFILGRSSNNDSLEKGKKPDSGEGVGKDKSTMTESEYNEMKKACESSKAKLEEMEKACQAYEDSIKKSEEEEAKEGDSTEAEGKGIEKSIEIKQLQEEFSNNLEKSISETNDLVKSLAEATNALLKRNVGVEESMLQSNKRVEDLEKSLLDITGKLDTIINTPIPSKSVTTTNYRQHPRLEKSIDGSQELHLVQDKKKILDLLDKASGLDTPNPDMRVASAMATYESSGYLDKGIIDTLQKSENVTIIG